MEAANCSKLARIAITRHHLVSGPPFGSFPIVGTFANHSAFVASEWR